VKVAERRESARIAWQRGVTPSQQTRTDILAAAYEMWIAHPYDEVSLDLIAENAGVSRQTVHRQFGSKDELFLAVMRWRQPSENDASFATEPGDVAAAVRQHVDRYERMGDALMRFLAMEGRVPAVDELLAHGRRAHRAELEHAFAPYLPRRGSKRREDAILALYAATDVGVWKLLRRDFGATRRDTEAIITQLVDGVLTTLGGATRTHSSSTRSRSN
jgi:AcrR family transcriptional regulator